LASNEQSLPEEVRQRFQQLRVVGGFPLEPAAVRDILVRSPNWVGDAIMSLPALGVLRGLFPRADLTVLAAPRVAPLFRGLPGVTEVVSYPAQRGKWQVLWGLRGRFDLALALPNSMESALGLWLAGIPARVGYNTDARRPFLTLAVSGRQKLAGLHTIYYYLGILTALGKFASFAPPALYLGAEEMEAAAHFLAAPGLTTSGPRVGFSPGATYGPAKRWPSESFAALAENLQEEFGARVVLLGGPEDREASAHLKEHLSQPVLDLVGRTDLRQALGVLSHLQLLVTNDSGLMHAAAALGVPLVALFGSTDPQATGPFTPKATVLRHPLACSPCFKRTCDEGYRCLTEISVAEVLAAARDWLNGGRA
jgi:heptosyltransferase-2